MATRKKTAAKNPESTQDMDGQRQETPKDRPSIRSLRFVGGGWCNELGKAYLPGLYRPLNQQEAEALRPYAVEVVEDDSK